MNLRNTRFLCAALLMMTAGMEMAAQTGVTTSGGTTNNVPAFNGTYTVGSSPIWISGSSVGIGASDPGAVLEVRVPGVGTTKIHGPNLQLNNFSTEYNLLVDSGNFNIQNDSDAGAPIRFTLQGGTGNIGIGTTSPQQQLHVAIPAANSLQWAQVLQNPGNYGGSTGIGVGLQFKASIFADGSAVENNKWSGIAGVADTGTAYADYFGLSFYTHSGIGAAPSEVMRIASGGNVGIGTTSPGAKLDVNGNMKISGAGANLTFPDSTVQSTAWTGVLSGGDYAESVDVTGERDAFEPGDLLVIDPNAQGHFQKANLPYSTLVGGVYATKPGVTGRRQPRSKPQDGEVPMAMVGIVPTKVSTENGPVHTGDLLVSSSTLGFAMKGTDRNRMMGAVIGKALASLEEGTGVIEVLISLQ